MPAGVQLAETESAEKAPDLSRSPEVVAESASNELPFSPDLSPRAAPAETAAAIAAGNGNGAVRTLAKVQAAFGNGYAGEVVAHLREARTRERIETAAPSEKSAPAGAPAAPARKAAPAAPPPALAPAVAAPAVAAPAPSKVEPPKTAAPKTEAAAAPAASPPAAALPGPDGAGSAMPPTPAAAPPAAAPAPPKPESVPPAAPEGKGPARTAPEPAQPAAARGAPEAGPAAAPPQPAAREAAEPSKKKEQPAAAPGIEGGAPATAAAGEAAALAPERKAPSSPQDDPAFVAVVTRAKAVARQQARHSPAQRKALEAQAAAPGPPNEVASQAAASQVGKMAGQKPNPFDKASFKAALMDKVKAITPKNLEEADDFKKKGMAASIKGDVAAQVEGGKEQAQGGIETAAKEAPDPSVAQPKEVTPLPPTEAGPPPPDVGAQAAAPKPKTGEEVSLQPGSRELDAAAASSDPPLDAELAAKSNEPQFQTAVDAKQQAQKDAEERPAQYRQEEGALLAGARQEALGSAAQQTQAMREVRAGEFSAVVSDQQSTQTEDQKRRTEVSNRVEEIYGSTKQKVEDRLKQLDTDVNTAFDSGAEQARQQFETYVDDRMRAYKDDRYGGPGGATLWLADKLLGLPDEVNVFYAEGRDLYIRLMDGVINNVAAIVETGLMETMALIEQGRQEVRSYVDSLPRELQDVGQKAAEKIQEKFDTLAQSVEDKKNQLVDSLAQKYADNLKAIDARIADMKAANRGLVDAALDAVKGVINTLIQLKNMLLGVLAKAANVIGRILNDPIGFLGNLIAAVKLGLDKFIANIGTHLKKGLLAWLFGALAEAGIQMPENFDLKGILSLVLQVLGLTYANIRARAVTIVGEPVVKALETGAEIFKILITEGPAGLWNYIKDQLSNLKDVVLDGIKSFVLERVIIAGITWLIGLLNPAAAFIKACKAIYDIIMFFVTRGSQIMALINAILDSMAAIAAGAIGGAAAMVENALGKAVPVLIGFLASLLGVGGISEKIREIIQKIQAPINKAIDWVINKAVKLVKNIAGLLGIGDKKKKADQPLDGVKGQARMLLRQKLSGDFTDAEARSAVAQVKAQLAPQGLRTLEIGPKNKKGEQAILAEASLKERIEAIAAKKIKVGVSATVTVTGEVMEGLLSTEKEVTRVSRPVVRYELGPSEAERTKFVRFPAARAAAMGGTGEAAMLPSTAGGLGKGYTARESFQPESGMIIKPPPGASSIEIVAWNTGEPVPEDNISHAEKQFISWFNARPEPWRNRVTRVDIHLTHNPCVLGEATGCAFDVATLKAELMAKGAVVTVKWDKDRKDAADARDVLEPD